LATVPWMKSFRTPFIIISILILTGGLIYFGWLFYLKIGKSAESPLKAIPENTALIFKLNKPSGLWEGISHGNLIWKEISTIPYIASLNEQIHVIDSLLKTNKSLYAIAQTSQCYAAMSLIGRSSYGFLFLTSLPGIDGESEITSMLEDSYGKELSILKNQYGSANLVRVKIRGQNEPFYFAVRSGVFMGSLHPELIRKAIDQLSLNIPSVINTGFQKVETTTGKKVDANIYINYKLIRPFVSRLMQSDQSQEVEKITTFADWSGLDVILKKDELLVNGYTTVTDTANQYLRIFSSEAPQKVAVTSILPDNTSRFIWTGFANIESYYRNFLSFTSRNEGYLEPQDQIARFETENQLLVRDYFLPWIGNEICLARALNDRVNLREDLYAVIKVKDHILADSSLDALQLLTGRKKDSIHYKSQVIRLIALPDLIPAIFGKPFAELSTCYFTAIGDYLVFGNTSLSLKYFIDHVTYDKVLNKDKIYLSLTDNLSDNTNLFYYFNTERILSRVKHVFSDELNAQLEPALDTLKKFESLTLQFTNKDGIFFTNLFVHYNPASGSQAPLEWQTKLDTVLFQLPEIAVTGNNREHFILACDVNNRLYQIDSAGRINWKIQIPGKPLGPVQVIHPLRKDSICYLIHTDHYLCLISESGKFLPGYPLQFSLKATGEVFVTESQNKRGFKLLIPMSDNKIHAFDLNGVQAAGWLNPAMGEGITQQVQMVGTGKKEFLFIKGRNGHLLITDGKGRPLMKPAKDLLFSKQNRFYLNKTNKKGTFLSTDPTGKIIYLKENWKTSEVTVNLFSPSHLFFYADINDDGKYEFIFYDRNKLFVYDHLYKLRYSYVFQREITTPPFLLSLPNGKKWISAVSGPANEIYLFGKDGLIELEPGIRGNSGITVVKIGNEGEWFLITGSGRTLKCYHLPKQ
jgi:hypothetical protein